MTASGRSPWRDIAAALAADRFVRWFAGGFAVIAVFYLTPFAGGDLRRALSWNVLQLPLLVIVAAAACSGISALGNREERRFWWFVAAMFALILLARARHLWLPVDTVTTSLLFLLTYLPLLLAVERQPHLGEIAGTLETERTVRSIGVTCLAGGWFAYFVLAPAAADSAFLESTLAQYYWFLALDALIAIRCLMAGLSCRQSRWRALYLALGVAAGVNALLHVADTLIAARVLRWGDGEPTDLLWAGHYFAYLLAIRLRHVPGALLEAPAAPGGQELESDSLVPVRTGTFLVAGASTFPLGHIAVGASRLIPPGIARLQSLVALVAFGLMAALAVMAYRTLARRRADLAQQRRAIEAHLEEAQRLEAAGRLAGGVAHDFNNLLTVIVGYADLAAEDLGQPFAGRHMLDEILQAGGRAQALTRQLLAFSRQQVLARAVVDLNRVITDIAPMLGRLVEEDIALEIRLAPALVPVVADAGQVQTVLIALAGSARQAMPGGGTLAISTSTIVPRLDATGERGSPAGGPWAEIVVHDTGAPVPADEQPHVFEPFFTVSGRGNAGLGLSAAYGIVTQSGGQIVVRSSLATGTAFAIRLPGAETSETRAAIES